MVLLLQSAFLLFDRNHRALPWADWYCAYSAFCRTFFTGVSLRSTTRLWSVVPSSQGFRFALPPACGLSYLRHSFPLSFINGGCTPACGLSGFQPFSLFACEEPNRNNVRETNIKNVKEDAKRKAKSDNRSQGNKR